MFQKISFFCLLVFFSPQNLLADEMEDMINAFVSNAKKGGIAQIDQGKREKEAVQLKADIASRREEVGEITNQGDRLIENQEAFLKRIFIMSKKVTDSNPAARPKVMGRLSFIRNTVNLKSNTLKSEREKLTTVDKELENCLLEKPQSVEDAKKKKQYSVSLCKETLAQSERSIQQFEVYVEKGEEQLEKLMTESAKFLASLMPKTPNSPAN
jgi:phage shock protein A